MANDRADGRHQARGPRPAPVRLPALLAGLVSRAIGRIARKQRAPLRRHELSVVACDLRGFTRFSSVVAPEQVVELLRGYYLGIADAVAGARGTIKDHAGDGALALVGAAHPSPDHAARAVAMAMAMSSLGDELRRTWRRAGVEIGIGIGVASGEVTIGTIEAGPRIEPVAIGAAVNLASRLCARARAGQILVDQRTVELLGGDERRRVEPLDTAEIKGFAHPVAIFQAIRLEGDVAF